MKRLGIALIAAAALVGVYFAFFHTDARTDLDAERAGDAEDGASLITGEEDGAESGVDAVDAPVLFTSGKKRSGVGSLRGQVKWFDSGEPAPELRVKIAGVGRKNEPIDITLTTDARGAFSLADIPAADELLLQVGAGTEHKRTIQSVVVEPDRVVDLGVLWLGQGGLLEGRVVDLEGNPIAGAEVGVHEGFGSILEAMSQMLDLFKKLDQAPETDHKGTTKADGTYAIANVPPGSIVVIARAPNFEAGVEETFKGARGESDRVDLTLSPGVPVTGVVVDTNGRGIGGARVVLIHQGSLVSGFLARTIANTDGLGRFELVAPPGGTDRVGVMVAAQNYPPSLFTIKSVTQPQRFVVQGGAELDIRVIDAASGKPLGNADLMAFIGDEQKISGEPNTLITSVTDEDGRVSFFARPGFLQMLWVNHPSCGNQMYVKAGMGMTSSVDIGDAAIKPGRNQRTVKVKIGTRIRGVVKSKGGEPISGARIRSMGGFGIGIDTLSDEEGRYECMMNPTMMMGLIATAPGWIQDMSEAMKRPTPGAPGEPIELDIVMNPSASVTGQILAPDGKPLAGARVRLSSEGGGGMMSMRMFSPSAEAVTMANGRFLLDGVAAGTKNARIMARHKLYTDSQTDKFDVSESGTTSAPNLVMKEGLTVVVQVVDTRGDAVGRASLEVDTSPTESINFEPMRGMLSDDLRMSNAAGKATLRALPAGQLTITASARGYAATRGSLELAADAKEPYTLEITLREAVDVKGRVIDQEGRGVAGVDVESVEHLDGADESTWVPRVRAESGSDGTFVLEGLPDVQLTLSVGKKGYLDGTVQVIGANRQTVEATLRKRDASVQREIESLEARIQEVAMKFGSAKGAEQKKLMEEIQLLQSKLARLKSEGDAGAQDIAVPAPMEAVEDDG